MASSKNSPTERTRAPKRIIIARHGQRVDRRDAAWLAATTRPQDAPLDDEGHRMASTLGQFLGGAGDLCSIDPKERLVVLSSPLTRCVETAHGILLGLGRSDAPIHIEEGLFEGWRWFAGDRRRRTDLSDEVIAPLWYSADHHAKHTSALVTPASVSRRTPLCCVQTRLVEHEGAAKTMEEVHGSQRCALAVSRMLADPFYFDATVIAVGHGFSTMGWAQALGGCKLNNPWYTAYADFWRADHFEATATAATFRLVSDGFHTPHLLPD